MQTRSPLLSATIASLPLTLLIVIYVIIRSHFWRYPPIWDARWYYEALLDARLTPFDSLSYSVAGHISQGFLIPAGIAMHLFGVGYFSLNVYLTIISILILLLFYLLLHVLTGGELSSAELTAFTAIVAFHPALLSSMIHFNVDIGILFYGLCYWVLLIRDRPILAGFVGIGFLFSKETAMLLLPIVAISCALSSSIEISRHNFTSWLRRHCLAILIPYTFLVIFVLYKAIVRQQSPLWTGLGESWTVHVLSSFDSGLPMLIHFLAMIFVLNGTWVLMLLWCILTIFYCSYSRRLTLQTTPTTIWITFTLSLMAILLVRPYSNSRYVMFLYPIMIIGVANLLVSLGVRRIARMAIASLLFMLFSIQVKWSVDPLSRLYFGTFNFGERSMYDMTQRTKECCGKGRDQLVYNLEFLELIACAEEFLSDIATDPDAVVVCNTFACWKFWENDMAFSRKLDSGNKGSRSPMFLPPDELLKLDPLPSSFYFVDFPNVNNVADLNALNAWYQVISTNVYGSNGYSINIYTFVGR